MKLNKIQIAEIEKYFSDWNLVYKEFHDEMFDHYCTEIETKMDKGIDFHKAFNETHQQFENLEEKVSYGEITRVYGLKALETSQYSAIDKKVKTEYFKYILKQLFSPRILFWIVVIIVQYKYLYNHFEIIYLESSKLSFLGGFFLGITYLLLALTFSNSSLIDSLKNSSFKFLLNASFTKKARFGIREIAILKLFIFSILTIILFFEFFALLNFPVSKISLTVFVTLFVFVFSTTIAYLVKTKLFLKDINILKIQF